MSEPNLIVASALGIAVTETTDNIVFGVFAAVLACWCIVRLVRWS